MGYRRERTVDVAFDAEHDQQHMRGFEAVMRRLSAREMLDLEVLQDIDEEKLAGDHEGTRKRADELFRFVAAKVVTWNLEDDDGGPVVPSAEALWAEDFGFTMALVEAWTDAIAGVSAPLAQPSSAGEPSAEASIPMETL